MKISKKIISLFVALMMVGIFSFSVKANTLPVQLYYATAYDDYSGAAGHINGYIAIQNLNYAKNVVVHYSYDNDGNWNDVSASYLKNNSDGYEVWSFTIPSHYFGHCSFAVKYEVNGQTYWDNNGGSNYTIGIGGTAFGNSVLCGTSANLTVNNGVQSFNGNITVKNIGNPKVVTVRYTTDNWATYKEVNATYKSTSSDNIDDYWTFSVNLPTIVNNVQYSISYTVNNTVYWDNNFGSNYAVTY